MAVIELDCKTALLAFCIQNPAYSKNLQDIVDLYENEDFIIAWYVRQYAKQHFNLTERALATALEPNALHWVMEKSEYVKRTESYTVAKDYIQNHKPDVQLVSLKEYANALTEIVLDRYRELKTYVAEIEDDDLPGIMKGVRDLYNEHASNLLIDDVFKLNTGAIPYIYYNRRRYSKNDVNTYINNKSNEIVRHANNIGKAETYEEKIARQQEESIKYQNIVFEYSLGKDFLSNPVYGRVTTINAMPKVGKSKFCYGEVIYPAICAKKNVLLLSGEMSGGDVQQQVLAKHIYCTTGGKKIPAFIISTVLGIIGARRRGTLTKAHEAVLRQISKETVDTIIIAEYELFHSGNFGKLDVVYNGDTEDPKSDLFYIENYKDGIIDLQRTSSEEDRYDVIILDHIGFIRSKTGKFTDTECMRYGYQDSKAIARFPEHPSHVYVINHSNTTEGKQAQKDGAEGKSMAGKKISGFGSSEEGKIADTSLAMTMNNQQEQDGLVSILVNYDRNMNHVQTYSTNEFEMVAQKDVCDFCLKGSVKAPYYYRCYKRYNLEEEDDETLVDEPTETGGN